MTFLLNIPRTLRDLPAPARIGLFVFFVAGLADGILMPFFALWAQRDANVPIEYIGLLLGCYAGGELLATPFVGGIADRVGRRPVLLVSLAGVGTGFLLLFFARGAWMAAAALLVIGIFESVLHPTAATVIADVTPAHERRGQFGLTRVMSNAGRMIGPAAGAVLALWSLGLVFAGSSAVLLLGALVVAVSLPETWTPTTPEDDDDEESLTALGAAFHDRRLAALLIPVAVIEIAASWVDALVPLYASNAGTLTASGIGLLFTYAGALSVVFQLPVIERSKRMSGFIIVLASGVALALAFALLLTSTALPILVAAITLLVFSQMLFGPLTQAVVSELAPPSARATYLAAFAVTGDLKDTAGPAIGTYLYAMSTSLPWLVGMPVAVLAAFGLALAARRHEASR